VARRLRQWRQDKGLTLGEVASRLRWSTNKLSRYERAEKPLAGPAEVIALAAVLGISEQERDQVVATCVDSLEGGAGWWTAYGPETVPAHFTDYLETEAEASVVCTVEVILIPGLLQTGDYAEALFTANASADERTLVTERRRLRQQRQARLDEASPLELHAIIHEAALTLPVGGTAVMAEQLDVLTERAAQPNVTVQMIPAKVGAYPWMGNAYHVLSFDDADSGAVFVDNLSRGIYLEDDAEVEAYTLNFERLAAIALDPETSAQRITEIRGGLT
jgi:transcriptional regulator with XRE-family HTH domain